MKATLSLGPFQDSSLPVICMGKAYKIYTENSTTISVKAINGVFGFVKEKFQQLYAEVNGKKYLISYSPSDYPLPREIEGDVNYAISTPDGKPTLKYYFIPKLPEKETIVQNPMDYAKNAAAKESTYLPKEMRQAGYDIVDGELKQPEKESERDKVIWEIIEDYQMSREENTEEYLNEPRFSYAEIEADLYRFFEKKPAQPQPVSFTPEQIPFYKYLTSEKSAQLEQMRPLLAPLEADAHMFEHLVGTVIKCAELRQNQAIEMQRLLEEISENFTSILNSTDYANEVYNKIDKVLINQPSLPESFTRERVVEMMTDFYCEYSDNWIREHVQSWVDSWLNNQNI